MIYLILTNSMKSNSININTIFMDCIYKIVTPGLKGYKFLIIVGYNNIKEN